MESARNNCEPELLEFRERKLSKRVFKIRRVEAKNRNISMWSSPWTAKSPRGIR